MCQPGLILAVKSSRACSPARTSEGSTLALHWARSAVVCASDAAAAQMAAKMNVAVRKISAHLNICGQSDRFGRVARSGVVADLIKQRETDFGLALDVFRNRNFYRNLNRSFINVQNHVAERLIFLVFAGRVA